MSWDKTETIQSCPCQVGTYTIIDSNSDWGQNNVTWIMNCPDCQINYTFYSQSYYRSGFEEQARRWVKTSSYKEALAFKEKANTLELQALNSAKEQHIDKLIEHFSTSNKKYIWEVLQKYIHNYKSLNTFYKHTKGMKKSEYIGDLFNKNDIKSVFKIICVTDVEFERILQVSEELKQKAESLLQS